MKLTHIYTNWRRLCSVGLLGMTMLVTAACGTAAGSSADQNAAQNNSQTGTLQAPTLDNTPVKDHYAVFNTTLKFVCMVLKHRLQLKTLITW